MGTWTGLIWLRIGPSGSSCRKEIEYSGSIRISLFCS